MKLRSALVSLGLAALPLVSLAGPTVEVARVKLVFAEPGWESIGVDLGDAKLDSARSSSDQGMFGALEAHSKVLTLRDAEGQAVMTMLVYATYGAARNLRITGECPPIPQVYVRDFTKGRAESPECVTFGGAFDGPDFVTRSRSRLAQAYAKAPFDVPRHAGLLRGFFANSTGALIAVEALIAPGFKGLAGSRAGAALPDTVAEPIAAWADAFGESARKALRSFSGEFVVPPVGFD